jgi:gentisate 1,2-dioxygenase
MERIMSIAEALAPAKDRQKFYDKLAPQNLAPLWEVLKGLVPLEPTSKFIPHVWRFKECREFLMEAGDLLTAEEAERRVLVFENPAMPGGSRITATMYSGMQLILPGEIAPAHRHTASALRFVLEGNLGYTAVAGERTLMERGDFVITPNWAWHDHGQEHDKPVIWIDGLDLHMINFFETAFSEHANDKAQMVQKKPGESQARWGANMAPFQMSSPFGLTTPIFNYKYKASREALMAIAAAGKPDAYRGHALRYTNPVDGGWTMPTIAAWLSHLPKGFETKPLRATDGQTVVVVQGEIEVEAGDKSFRATEGDVIAMPSWVWRKYRASKDAITFTFSDRSAQEKLGLYREELR